MDCLESTFQSDIMKFTVLMFMEESHTPVRSYCGPVGYGPSVIIQLYLRNVGKMLAWQNLTACYEYSYVSNKTDIKIKVSCIQGNGNISSI